MPAYKVMIDDNFDYMDEDARYEHGSYDSAAEAIEVCRRIVEDDLRELYKEGMTSAELYDHYKSFGRDPFIVALEGAERVAFSAWTYAEERCRDQAK
jgi:hypothetical protein